jgi:glycosyltransferase involved in cell wall biosynthesis
VSTPIRCAHVIATTGATGAERHLEVLLGGLDRTQVAPVLFVPGPGPLVERVRALGFPVEPGAPARKLAFGAARRLARAFAGRFDLVHAHGPRAAFWAVRAARAAGLPFLATIHELRWTTLPPGPRRALWIWLEDRSLQDAAQLLAVSGTVRDALVERHPEWAARTSVVYGSSPLLRGEPTRAPRPEGGPLRIVSVGRLDWVKGTDTIVDALGVLANRGVSFEADIVGEGPEGPDLHERARRLGIGLHLRWHDAGADVAALLVRADAFVTATRFETFGMAVLEAMAFSVPVVAPAIGGVAELLTPDTGVLVEPEPRDALAERLAAALADLADDPARRARLGAAAAQRARDTFGPEALADGVTAAYRRVLGARAAGG